MRNIWLTFGMQGFFFLSAIGLAVAYFVFPFSDHVWFAIWRIFIIIWIVNAIIAFIWLLVGGTFDLRATLQLLKTAKRNQLDDGTVTTGRNRRE